MDSDKSHVYILQAEGTNYFKVGRTADIEKRLESLRTGCPFDIVAIGFYRVDRATELEMFLHFQLRKYRVRLEWFDLPKDVLDVVKKNLEAVCKECDCSMYCRNELVSLDQEFKHLFDSASDPVEFVHEVRPKPLEAERSDLTGAALGKTDEQLNRTGVFRQEWLK